MTGLGLVGTGVGGGGTGEGTIGLGSLGTIGYGGGGGSGYGYGRGEGGLGGRRVSDPDVVPGLAQVRGSLDKEIIRRVVRRHLNEVRFCYEKELQPRVDYRGQTRAVFVIAPSGEVVSASADFSESDSAIGPCVANAIRRWKFPASSQGSSVVTYPFVFEVAGR
jgi:hypothetical protein